MELPPRHEGAPSGPRWRRGKGVLAGLGFLAAMWVAGAFDLAWVWMLAEVPPSDELERVGGTLLEGREAGLPDVVLAMYLLAGLWFLLGWPRRAPGLLRRGRGVTGRLALAGLVTVAAGLALRILLARPGPLAVLAARVAFYPWYWPWGLPPANALQHGSCPALSTVLAGLTVTLAWQLPARFGELRRFLVVAAICGTGVLGVLEVYAQHHWPSDVVAGAGLALLVPWLLWRPHGGRRQET